MPEVTIFIAAFNAEKYIATALNSVLSQTFGNFEVIVVNDGSKDSTGEIVAKFSDSRIRYFENEGNMGLVFTRNRLKTLARGKYIAILDSDDIAHLDRIKLQYEFLEANPHVVLCGGHAREINGNGEFEGRLIEVPTGKNLAPYMLLGNPFVNSSTMFRSDDFAKLGGYRDFPVAEDYDLFVRMSGIGVVTNLNHVLVDYRIHATNTTKIHADSLIFYQKQVIVSILSFFDIKEATQKADLYYEIFSNQLITSHLSLYLGLLKELRKSNDRLVKYEQLEFNRILHQLSYNVIMNVNTDKNALGIFVNSGVFYFPSLTFKQFRKVFKKSVKNFFRHYA